jgi:3-isopropylmalate/(R)-2-methylmalate dehydratase large subunit
MRVPTLAQRILRAHAVDGGGPASPSVVFVDLHLVHDLTSQAFSGLASSGRRVRRPDLTVATVDHNVPTIAGAGDELSARQLAALATNCADHGIRLFGLGHENQGIVHVVGPQLGLTQPGMLIACPDSHTPTHGGLGALAFGIGLSEVEHVLATQCLRLGVYRQVLVRLTGTPDAGTAAKDIALHLIRGLGADAARDAIVEFQGPAVRAMEVEERLTLCNLAAEMGARTAVIAPDQRTVAYLSGRPYTARGDLLVEARQAWAELVSDVEDFDQVIEVDVSAVEPTVTWGTTPAMSSPVSGRVPLPEQTRDQEQTSRALAYMGLRGGEAITDIAVDRVFIGSCANARLSDLRQAAAVLRGSHVAPGVRAMVVPGSARVKRLAEQEGLADQFVRAGFEWRDAGCSMCLAMNGDELAEGERCAATSNRNFEGRQGRGGRTHLVSPAMAAGAAIAGHFVDVRTLAR